MVPSVCNNRQTLSQSGKEFVCDRTALPSHIFCPNDFSPICSNDCCHITWPHARHIGHIHHQLIHAHSPHHRTARSVKQYLSPLLGQAARQAVGIADGNHCQPPHLIRPKGQAVSCSLAGQEGAHRSYPGAQGKHWVQIQLSFCVGIIAEDTVKGDSCPCPGTWLRRQIPDAVACLDVDCSRVQAVGLEPSNCCVKSF